MFTNAAGQVLIDIMDYPACSANLDAKAQIDPSNCSPKQQQSVANNRTEATLKNKECRCLLAQYSKREKNQKSQWMVAELFSPPRFIQFANKLGHQGKAYDIKTGYDLEDKSIRN